MTDKEIYSNNNNIKPKFNLEWYKGSDLYSEGDVENLIVDIIAKSNPEDYAELIDRNFSWSTYYHLTHIRKNILNWYPLKKNASLLEIGCGFGAITNMLCEKCEKVVAVELSKRRATGALLRCREKENLEIIVGNLNDIEFNTKFDYITLIGVLEYQGSYSVNIKGQNPYEEFLKKIKTLLKPEGRLLIGIENKYGLKYWCGAREDHTSIPFDGINQYNLSKRNVKTFSRNELLKMLERIGLKKHYCYYPMPDYKLPQVIYSEKILPQNENMFDMQYYNIPDSTTLIANEKNIYKDLIDNNVFEFFANSFLIECTEKGEIGEVTFASLNSKRITEYQICTRFKDGIVEKFPIDKVKGNYHIQEFKKNETMMSKRLSILPSKIEHGIVKTEYKNMKTIEDLLCQSYIEGDSEKIYELWKMLYNEILKSSEHISPEESLLVQYGLIDRGNINQEEVVLKTGFIDMIPRNAFYEDGKCIWYDQEWMLENVPANYVLYRGINIFYNSYSKLVKSISLTNLASRLSLLEQWKSYQILEHLFIKEVMDINHMKHFSSFAQNNKHIVENINKIIR